MIVLTRRSFKWWSDLKLRKRYRLKYNVCEMDGLSGGQAYPKTRSMPGIKLKYNLCMMDGLSGGQT